MGIWRLAVDPRALSITLFVLVSAALAASPAKATPSLRPATGDQLTLALDNGPTFTYIGQPGGTPAPMFTATVTFSAKPTANTASSVAVTIAGQTIGTSFPPNISPDGLTYTFIRITGDIAVPVGQQSAVASYYDVSAGTTLHSNSVSFTVVQATPQPQCTIYNYVFMNDPGQTMQFHIIFEGDDANAPVDWQDATYTITFKGNNGEVYNDANLVPDSQAVVTAQAPTNFDWYTIDCMFNGTQSFAPATTYVVNGGILVSAKHPLGTVHFSSNPWPWQQNKPFQIDVKVDPTSGGPTPDGYFSLGLGENSWSNYIQLGSNGETVATFTPQLTPWDPGLTTVYIRYQGDPYYGEGTVSFPVPSSGTPTPGSGAGNGRSGGGQSSSSSQGTTAASTQVALSASGAHGTSTTGGSSASPGALTRSPSYTGVIIWIVVVVVLMLGGGVGGWLYLSRRGNAS